MSKISAVLSVEHQQGSHNKNKTEWKRIAVGTTRKGKKKRCSLLKQHTTYQEMFRTT